jgi:hypothetical protein
VPYLRWSPLLDGPLSAFPHDTEVWTKLLWTFPVCTPLPPSLNMLHHLLDGHGVTTLSPPPTPSPSLRPCTLALRSSGFTWKLGEVFQWLTLVVLFLLSYHPAIRGQREYSGWLSSRQTRGCSALTWGWVENGYLSSLTPEPACLQAAQLSSPFGASPGWNVQSPINSQAYSVLTTLPFLEALVYNTQ